MSDHFRNGRFFNPNGANGQPLRKVPWMLTERGASWPTQVPVVPQPAARPPSADDIVVTFIGHATFLIQSPTGNIITDPVFSQRAGPFGLAGPRRVKQPGVRLEDLPPIDLVLLSHNHYDHCDLRALRALGERDRPSAVTLLANGRLLRSAGFTTIDELDWWDPVDISTKAGHLQIAATRAQHFSARTPFDRNRALWGGFIIDVGPPGQTRRIYFAGDSGYGPHFEEIGQRFAPIDLALIPIGAYDPRWFMKDIHMNPEEAVQAHIDVGARHSIGMHFGTFRMTSEPIDEPAQRMAQARVHAGLPDDAFVVLELGESRTL